MPKWKKGDPSPNPAGRPVGAKSFTTKVRTALEKIADGKDYTYEEAFIKSILKKAIVDQDPTMMKLIWNYLDGKPHQSLDLGNDGQPFQIIIKRNDGKNGDNLTPLPGSSDIRDK